MKLIPTCCFALVFSLLLYSCADEKEIFDDRDTNPEVLKAYIPLEVGKYYTYKLDSTVFIQLGRGEEVHSYQEKHVIQAVVTDNQGRISYRVFRYIRDLAGLKDWTQNGTYYITPLNDKVEVIESNQRIINLIVPVKEGFSWKGNSYLPSDLYISTGFTDINNWDFVIQKTGEVLTLSKGTYTNVITVERFNDENVPDTVVVSKNKAVIPANISAAMVTGNPDSTVEISATPPTNSFITLTIYNRTYQPLVLNKIIVPARKTRSFDYENGAWVFGNRDSLGNRIDTVVSDLPNGTRGHIVDKYSKNVGLIYSEFVLWTSNPNYVDSTNYKVGVSVRRELLEHN